MKGRSAFLVVLLLLSVVYCAGCTGTTASQQSSGDTAFVSENNAPSVTSLTSASGTSVYSSSVTLNLSASDDTAVAWYYASESPSPPDASTEWVALDGGADYSGDVQYTLSDGYGTKTVYVWVKDSNSNMSMAASVSVNRAFMARTTDRPNVIMIVIDTLRADRTSMHGSARDTSPYLNEFKKSAVFFENAISQAPWTTPSYTSMLLSRMAYNLVDAGGGDVEYGKMLNQNIEQAGYRSVSIQTNVNVAGVLDLGFDEYYGFTDDMSYFPDQMAVDKAISYIDYNEKGQFFMFMGLISPHWNYEPDNGYFSDYFEDSVYLGSTKLLCTFPFDGLSFVELPPEVRAVLGAPAEGLYYQDSRLYEAAYDGEITFTDYHINRLFDTLKRKGLYENSLIIVTSDHGENMTDHAIFFSHGGDLFNSLIHVPLMIKFPGQTETYTVKEYVRTMDILPTVIDYLSLEPAPGAEGKTLMPVINKEAVNFDERPLISFTEDLNIIDRTLVSVIKDGYKLIRRYDGDTLYNLTDDPNETINLTSSNPEKVELLKAYLDSFYVYSSK